jgi:hypothetical protein
MLFFVSACCLDVITRLLGLGKPVSVALLPQIVAKWVILAALSSLAWATIPGGQGKHDRDK